MRLHFRHPLRDESLGHDDEDAPRQAAQFEFAHDESGLDGFAQADFIAKQEADAILRDGAAERLQLVRQGYHRRAGRREQHVFAQQIGNAGSVENVTNASRVADFGGIERFEPVGRGSDNTFRGWQPDVISGVIPKARNLDHLAWLPVFDAP